jgi:hypothetical protein
MAISSIDYRQTRDKAPLSVGLNLEKTEFLANESPKMIHHRLKVVFWKEILYSLFQQVLNYLHPKPYEGHQEIQRESCSPNLVPF